MLLILSLWKFRETLEIIADFYPIDVVVKKNVGCGGAIYRMHKAGKGHVNFIFPTTRMKKQRTTTMIAMASRCWLR